MTNQKTLASLAVLVQSGKLDPVKLVEETFHRIEAHPDRSIFVGLTRDRAIKEAQAASSRLKAGRSLGLLDGLPVAWKDLFDLAGSVTTAGSVVFKDNPPAAADAPVVGALAAAGMVSVGRTNMSEFAFSGLGINPHYGTPRNPASPDVHRIPGGSSSGSAAAVAAGLVPLAIGTDTGGSVRIPAAMTGIVGYKATRGRYAMKGVFPLAESLDALGPLCHTVQDAVWADAAMHSLTAPVIRRAELADLSLVIPETIVFDEAEPEVVAAFEAAIKRLEAVGVRVRRAAFPSFAAVFDLMARHGALVTAEAYALHRERLAGPEAAKIDPRVVTRTRLGEKITLSDYITLLDARDQLIHETVESLALGELIAHPTLPHVAPPVAPLLSDDELFFKINAKTLRNTLIGNFLDFCGVSIPCGTGAAGMPVGFLLSAPHHQDDRLLGAALAAEATIRGEA
ncbi:aspartyl-tRNA(Asn)/glutamyl-tRNA(Gln) amidotransferase subunit A [Sinorhizobium terangae]|uniref:Indoleacetamide hydrolase n=1 Tax=Sinorhizobium terangae TaxID=110322 RepID=A0A6N7LKF8_SINTE|nr:amidase [Sinorhizobium terangae]MBB4183516.1 aspartyl-tRNA(Asn)/glutamyl-tRNA(Gln) amidotransferase subunit A [Sinorhizobium terangae]MQX17315.1 amidase [Sinorhizobium terangae]